MFVVCDTCSLVMLLRIAPDMFTDERYQCVTIQAVLNEYVRNKRFKVIYPWRDAYRSHVKPILQGKLVTPEFIRQQRFVDSLASTAHNPRKRNRPYELSATDKDVLATAVTNGWELTTVEHNLTDFTEQEFGIAVHSPLHLVNNWLEAGLFHWDDARQGVLDDWIAKNERRQPPAEIKRFERLTSRKYPAA